MSIDYIIATSTLVIMSLVYKKYKYRIIYFIPLLSIFIEATKGFIGEDSKIIGFRNLFISLVLIFLWLQKKIIKKSDFNVKITLLYFFILVFFSSNLLLSLLNYQMFFNSLLLLSLSYHLTKNLNDFSLFLGSLKYVLIIMIISIIGFSIFEIGYNPYSLYSDFSPGIFLQNRIYPAAFILLMTPLIYQIEYRNKNKILMHLISFISIIIILINMRRSAILILIFGLLIFIFIYRQRSKIILGLIGFLALAFTLLPIYKDILEDQVYARIKVLQYSIGDLVENERRLMEFPIIFDEIVQHPNSMSNFYFGKEVFNSAGNYANGTWGERLLHVDFNIILHGSGVIGVILYFSIFYKLFLSFRKDLIKIKYHSLHNSIIVSFVAVFLSLILITFSSGLFSFTYRSIVFIFLGSTLSIIEKQLSPIVNENLSLR